MAKLAAQREQHHRYRRYIVREPTIDGYQGEGPWTPVDVDPATLNLEDPHHDNESRLRDLADEILDDGDRAARISLESFIERVAARDIDRALLVNDRRLIARHLHPDASKTSDLRYERSSIQQLVVAMHALYYADLLEEANAE